MGVDIRITRNKRPKKTKKMSGTGITHQMRSKWNPCPKSYDLCHFESISVLKDSKLTTGLRETSARKKQKKMSGTGNTHQMRSKWNPCPKSYELCHFESISVLKDSKLTSGLRETSARKKQKKCPERETHTPNAFKM